jgi:hypothetical protein
VLDTREAKLPRRRTVRGGQTYATQSRSLAVFRLAR